ncbi:MAG: hypothetical protein RR577_05945 [Erysipelotrichales bacterium]
MKKIYALLLIVLLSACSNKDPIEEHLKKDIVIETNKVVKIDDVVEVNNIKDDKLKQSLQEAKYKINYKENELIDKKDIKEDKIFATNKLNIEYKFKDKDYTKDLDVKIKDTIIPTVSIKKDKLFYSLGSKISKEGILKDISPSISDNGQATTSLKDYETINFNKAGSYDIELIVSDEANNEVVKKIEVKVEDYTVSLSVPLANCCGLKAKKITFVFPSNMAQQYKFSKTKLGGTTDAIVIENNNEKYYISVPTPYQLGFPGFNHIEEYKRNKFNISLMKTKEDKNTTLASVYSLKYDHVGFVVTKNKKQGDLKNIVNTIVDNVKIK